MSEFLTLLTLFLPLLLLSYSHATRITTPPNCTLTPYLCPNNNNITILADHTHRIKPAPPTIITGLDPATSSGDILNTTNCYCASRNWQHNHTFGAYHLITYYNYHHDRLYSIKIDCRSPEYKVVKHYHDDRVEPECLRERRHERWCTSVDIRGELGNRFCYEFDGGSMSDTYRFNKQKRGIPRGAAFRESQMRTLEICDGECGALGGGMVMLDGMALTAVVNDAHGVGPSEWSAILSFGDTDDMCETCK